LEGNWSSNPNDEKDTWGLITRMGREIFAEIKRSGKEIQLTASLYDIHMDKIRDIGLYAA